MEKIKYLHGLTTYWNYGGGDALFDIRQHGTEIPYTYPEETFGFKTQRAFADNFRFHYGNPNNTSPSGDGRLMVDRTAQGWWTDEYLDMMKNQYGIKTIWCTAGKMGFHNTTGKRNKVNPIEDSADRMLESSWKDAAELAKQIVIRYADDTAEHLDKVNVYAIDKPGDLWYLSNEPKAGLGTLDAIEIGNEWNFPAEWSKGKATLTPEEYAVFFKTCYDAIRSVSNIEIIMGGGLGGVDNAYDYIPRFLNQLDKLYESKGEFMPTDFAICFHWYMRDGGSSQSGGIRGASPEEVNAYTIGKEMDAICQEWGLEGWYNTETGWSAAADGTLDTSKNSAPIQEGLTQLESQAALMQRLTLIWGACDYCKGITYWHCKDYYDTGAFLNGGVRGPNGEPKPARDWSYDFINQWGDYYIKDFVDNGDETYEVTLYNDVDQFIVGWSNGVVVGEYTPVPKMISEVVEPPVPPQPPTPPNPILPDVIEVKSIEIQHSEGCDPIIINGPIKLHL